jgi:cholera toxin transcriptional activator
LFLTAQAAEQSAVRTISHLRRSPDLAPFSDTLAGEMTDPQSARRYRFGVFEADAAIGELRRQGIRVKLNAQPFQVLLMLLERPGKLLTREEIARELWTDGTFVDYEHGVNSALNRIREALGDTASNPKFVETLARRGYRFVAPVERILPDVVPSSEPLPEASIESPAVSATVETEPASWILASAHELPKLSRPAVQSLFVVFQFMYLAFYIGALTNLPEIEELLSSLPRANVIFIVLIVTAAILIPVRAFVLTAVLFHAPRTRENLLKLWRFLLPLDELWALSPFLLLHHINFGLALSCTALLVYSPFVQRSLILMGAGAVPEVSVTAR